MWYGKLSKLRLATRYRFAHGPCKISNYRLSTTRRSLAAVNADIELTKDLDEPLRPI